MTKEKSIICIDFGTSSIRAAIRDSLDELTVLEIGEADKSQLDRASIPSAVLISTNLDKVYIGTKAVEQTLNGQSGFLYEISPKKWIVENVLNDSISDKTKLTRLDVLSALLNHCLVCISKSIGIPVAKLSNYEIRISHPVWEKKFRPKHKQELEKILSNALKIQNDTFGEISTSKLLNEIKAKGIPKTYSEQDTLEPVAAALELFSNTQNTIEFCVIIDVGAGTTDMAAFISATPSIEPVKRKLIQVSDPISLYQAGDTLDEEILEIIKDRNKSINVEMLRDLSNRRRPIKESLFKLNKIYEGNVSVSIADLEKRPNIKLMCNQINNYFAKIISSSSPNIVNLVNARDYPINEVTVIFAGGGSNIKMFHEAIGKFVVIENKKLPITIGDIKKRADLPADYQRLAVSLGGTTRSQDWPIDKFTDLSKSHRAYYL